MRRPVREALQAFLEDNLADVLVLHAASGPEGLALIAAHRVDLVITDFNMPDMNGTQFLAEARRLNPAIQRIMVTAFLPQALQAGLEDELVLQKPFDPEALLEDLRDALRRAEPAQNA